MSRRDVLISGAGIAGLTLAIELKQSSFEPLVIERAATLSTDGYMIDFFGIGWDVAERIGLAEQIRAIRYPIDTIEYIDAKGKAQITVPLERVRHALRGRYNYLRRTDLARILHERARALGIEVRFGTTIESLHEYDEHVRVTFAGGGNDDFALVFGADGVHSRVRELAFGPKRQFERYVGYYVAAFHINSQRYDIGRAVKLYEEPDRLMAVYPLDERRLETACVFRRANAGRIPQQERHAFLRRNYAGAGWLAEQLLSEHQDTQPLYFDPADQIVMTQWYKGRIALLGDACGCLTLLAAQGSHMAMAGGFVLANELARQGKDYHAAFASYQAWIKPHVEKKQRAARRAANLFVQTKNSRPWLRRAAIRLLFSAPLVRYTVTHSGATIPLPARAPDRQRVRA